MIDLLIRFILLFLIFSNCGCFDQEYEGFSPRKDSVNMVFQIELPKNEFILQESIPIKFRLVNNGDPVGIPLEYKSSDVVALSLFDHENRSIARADGYTKSIRLDPAGERIAQADMRTEELGAGQAMEWEDNLLRYMDIEAPGRYFVQARFQFQPGDISLES